MATTYYPYLRAKQNDVIAVDKVAKQLAQNGSIVPIFEPVNAKNEVLIKRSESFGKHDVETALVLNPRDGALANDLSATRKLLTKMRTKGARVRPAFIIDQDTTLQEFTTFTTKFPGTDAIFLHNGKPNRAIAEQAKSAKGDHILQNGATESAYEKSFPRSNRSRIIDAFQAQQRNSDYPPRSFFSDLHLTHKSLGFSGFGDYTILSKLFRKGGGPAFAVAIHVTEQTPTGVDCNHFVSTSNATQSNPGGKFGEALSSLMAYSKLNKGKVDFSDAFQEFRQLHTSQHFPGLGVVKRLCIQHHLELMCKLV